jgi:hypothetical protein
MRLILNLFVKTPVDHRMVFDEFGRGLARVLRRVASRARVRAVSG